MATAESTRPQLPTADEASAVNRDLFRGSDQDAGDILDMHRAYLRASSNRLDAEALKQVWSAHPSCVFFHSAGYILRGLSDWLKLWDRARQRLTTSSPWRSFDVRLIGDGKMAVVTASRTTGFVIDGENKEWRSRSTEVFAKEDGQWKCVHIHVSNAADNPDYDYEAIEKSVRASSQVR
jgi:ketosteroid isomerase-like protein